MRSVSAIGTSQEQSDSASRSPGLMDLGAVCGESRTHGSEGGRVP
jgi:hypothetical protein